MAAVAANQGVHHQWRKRKVIYQMGLVRVAKIGQIFAIRHIRFGNDDRVIVFAFNQYSQQLDDFMGLGQMNTSRAEFLPQERDSIEAEPAHAFLQIKRDYFCELE